MTQPNTAKTMVTEQVIPACSQEQRVHSTASLERVSEAYKEIANSPAGYSPEVRSAFRSRIDMVTAERFARMSQPEFDELGKTLQTELERDHAPKH